MVRPPYRVVFRLIAFATDRWDALDQAWLEYHRPEDDLLDLPLYRFLDFVYWFLVKRVEADFDLDSELDFPLPGEGRKPPTDATLADEAAGFMDLMGKVGG